MALMEHDEDLTEEAWLAEPPKRSRLRALLVALLAGALVFFAGVQVQKRWGEPAAASAAGPAGLPTGFTPPSGAEGGGFPGGGQQGATGASDEDDTAAKVIGTLVSVKDGVWTVEDLGGTRHEITVGSDVRVVQETRLASDDVEDGATVDIDGTTDDQGQVTATTVTVR